MKECLAGPRSISPVGFLSEPVNLYLGVHYCQYSKFFVGGGCVFLFYYLFIFYFIIFFLLFSLYKHES